MAKVDDYRKTLQTLDAWDDYLLGKSGLPGRRANIELARAVAEEGDAPLFFKYVAVGPDQAPANTPGEFLAFCGVLGLGRLLAEGDRERVKDLRSLASDPRWRVREAVAMALQRLGKVDMPALLQEMKSWSLGSALERRAAAAAVCEPDLLATGEYCLDVLQLLDAITRTLLAETDRRDEAFKALRKGLGYCWSVAVVACPETGKRRMARWFTNQDPDVRWVMRQNLKKKRLARLDAAWVEKWIQFTGP